ncbi:MAG: hypothetical protein POELPBGB_02848 [Bacteroidia bacterium]|nr:hypothetical protein [Bacteroidia bacterium]
MPTIELRLNKQSMRKQPVMNELSKLQHYIKRFCPELSNVTFSQKKYKDLSEEEQEKLIKQYISNIKALSTDDNRTN